MSKKLGIVNGHKERKDRWAKLMADEEGTMETICVHIASGGTLITITENWDIPFGWPSNWIHKDKARNARYIEALNDRAEWAKERVLQELRMMGLIDIRKIFNADGGIKPPSEWPDDIARAVASLEVNELFEGVGKDRIQIGHTKKLKLTDKKEVLKLLGQNLSLFIERHEHSLRVTLEDLVEASRWTDEEVK